jgi:indolepyruvate ferredoxin oxidoreductase beta subunit
METVNFVLSGLGGQGILFMTKILAQAALAKDMNVMGAETHGMAQRGGSVVSHLRLGDVRGSLVGPGGADFVLALEENEAYRSLAFVRRGGRLYSDAAREEFPVPEVKAYLDEMEAIPRGTPALRTAMELGAPMSANLALLGFFSAFEEGPFRREDLRDVIERISPERFRQANVRVFDAGWEKGRLKTA